MPSSFGDQLRRLRERAGLTQADLADRAGLTAQAISALERGARRQPYPHTVNALAAALGLGPEERAALLSARGRPAAAPPEDAPPPIAAPSPRGDHNLPAQVSSFIGRAAEIAELGGLVRSYRLVTLTGAGGSGKTRLALAVADAVAPSFPAGAWLVELAGFSEPAFLLDAVARTLGLHPESEADLLTATIDYLRPRELLLLLDNCEHLIDACAALVERLLAACPRLYICATSREVLRVPGERVYLVPTLPVPNPAVLSGADELALYDAVRLFAERAAAQQPGFRLTPANAQAVATICWRLDGIPLAIELAAARIRVMPPQQIVERLSQSLRLLTGGSRTAPARQQTLRGTLDWSYNLLDAEERELFRRLSVFAGGWDLESADVVGASFRSDAAPVADLLVRLVEQSLVLADLPGPDGRARYRMLEPVRQYALQLLEESGEAGVIRGRHAAVCLALAEHAHPELRRAGQIAWLDRLSHEHDNLRAALGWAIRAGEVEVAARIAWCLWPFWWIRAYQAEGRRWIGQILARGAGLPPALRARALMAAATMSYGTGDVPLTDRMLDDLLGYTSQHPGDQHAVGFALMGKGLTHQDAGRLAEAGDHLRRAIPLLERHGEAGIAAQMRGFLGATLLLQGDDAGAERCFHDGLAAGRALGDRLAIGNALFSLAQLALTRDDPDRAETWLREGVPVAHELGDRAGLAFIVEGLALVALLRGDDRRAARRFGAAEALRERVGLRGHTYYGPYLARYDQARAELAARLGPAALAAALAEGRALSIEQALL